LKYQKAFRLS